MHPTHQFYALKDLIGALFIRCADELLDEEGFVEETMSLVHDIAGAMERMPEPVWVWKIETDRNLYYIATREQALQAWHKEQDRSRRVGSMYMEREPSEREYEIVASTPGRTAGLYTQAEPLQ